MTGSHSEHQLNEISVSNLRIAPLLHPEAVCGFNVMRVDCERFFPEFFRAFWLANFQIGTGPVIEAISEQFRRLGLGIKIVVVFSPNNAIVYRFKRIAHIGKAWKSTPAILIIF